MAYLGVVGCLLMSGLFGGLGFLCTGGRGWAGLVGGFGWFYWLLWLLLGFWCILVLFWLCCRFPGWVSPLRVVRCVCCGRRLRVVVLDGGFSSA